MVLIINQKKAWIFLLFLGIMGVALFGMPHIKSADDWQTIIREAEAGECQEESVTLPPASDPVFVRYNDLQKESGFDLSPYAGKEVVKKTFLYPPDQTLWQLNLLYDHDTLVGGDWTDIRLDGRMLPLSQLQRSIP